MVEITFHDMVKHRTTVTIVIEYEDDGRKTLPDDLDKYVANMIVERASSHNHTIEEGITITAIDLV